MTCLIAIPLLHFSKVKWGCKRCSSFSAYHSCGGSCPGWYIKILMLSASCVVSLDTGQKQPFYFLLRVAKNIACHICTATKIPSAATGNNIFNCHAPTIFLLITWIQPKYVIFSNIILTLLLLFSIIFNKLITAPFVTRKNDSQCFFISYLDEIESKGWNFHTKSYFMCSNKES